MKKIICDKCGCERELRESWVEVIIYQHDEYDDDDGKDFDLCPSCSIKLSEWLSEQV